MSRALYNTEQHHLHFRLLIALEMAEYPQFCESYSNELVAACTPRQWAGLIIHLYAASGALQIAFRSYCPPVLHDLFFSTPLSRKICGRGVANSAHPITVLMWTSSFVPNSEREFRPDHFCILLPTTSRVHYVDLTLNHDSSIDDVILENNDSIFLDHTSTPSSIESIV